MNDGGVRFDTLERKSLAVIGLWNFISHLNIIFLLDHGILSLLCFLFVPSTIITFLEYISHQYFVYTEGGNLNFPNNFWVIIGYALLEYNLLHTKEQIY